MTQDVNPNSRAAFTDQSGRLTKYGMDVIRQLFQAIGLIGDSNDVADLLEAFDTDIATASVRATQSRILNDVEKIENDYETAIYKAKIKKLEHRIVALETAIEILPTKSLLKRIEDIEAQL